ncbi:MAG: hypothetical protein LBR12_02075, partial [Opitutaceae bacterium]|nr:hypothetical protein [Opitutaceae bacterium]
KLAPSNLPAANITVTDASGAALPFTLAADGTLSLLPALIPAALPLNAFLAYALIPGPDATLPATNGSTAHLPVTRISNDTLSINFTPARAGFTYEIQRSLDLQTWETLQTIPGGSSTPLTLVSPLPVSAAPKQFLRLKITPKN